MFVVYEVTLNMPALHQVRQIVVSPGNPGSQLSEEDVGPLIVCISAGRHGVKPDLTWDTWGIFLSDF